MIRAIRADLGQFSLAIRVIRAGFRLIRHCFGAPPHPRGRIAAHLPPPAAPCASAAAAAIQAEALLVLAVVLRRAPSAEKTPPIDLEKGTTREQNEVERRTKHNSRRTRGRSRVDRHANRAAGRPPDANSRHVFLLKPSVSTVPFIHPQFASRVAETAAVERRRWRQGQRAPRRRRTWHARHVQHCTAENASHSR